MSHSQVQTLIPRLRAAGEDAASKRDAFAASKERRDALIVEAIDNGIPQQQVADAAGVSRALVNKALLESQLVELDSEQDYRPARQ